MKNTFIIYLKIWILAIAILFTVLFGTYSKYLSNTVNYDSRYWTAFLFVVATFIGNLVFTYYAFRAGILIKKLFLNLPLVIVNFLALTIMLIVGAVLILICSSSIVIIVCTIIFAFNAITVTKTKNDDIRGIHSDK